MLVQSRQSKKNRFFNYFLFVLLKELCLQYYTKDERCDPTRDPLLSPILFNDEVLQRLPQMRITCGELDCLKDDSIRFLHKLVKVGRNDATISIYKFLRHGYLVKRKIKHTLRFMFLYWRSAVDIKTSLLMVLLQLFLIPSII